MTTFKSVTRSIRDTFPDLRVTVAFVDFTLDLPVRAWCVMRACVSCGSFVNCGTLSRHLYLSNLAASQHNCEYSLDELCDYYYYAIITYIFM